MKLLRKALLTTTLSLISITGFAEGSTLHSLTSCDVNFFKSLKAIPALSFIDKKVKGNDFKKNDTITVDIDYTTPEGIHLKQFTARYTNFNKYKQIANNDVVGEFYYWGFNTPDPLDVVVNKFPVRLKKDSDTIYTANAMIRDKDGQWKNNKSSASGIAPAENTAEKLFMAESSSEGYTTLYCSIQGNINQSDIKNAGLIK